jgi:hypothetical protein
VATIWDPKEANSTVYEDVEKYSGMIIVRYRPPKSKDLERLKNTDAYRESVSDSEATGDSEAKG